MSDEQEPIDTDDGSDGDDQEAGKILPDRPVNQPVGIVRSPKEQGWSNMPATKAFHGTA